ncbi:hypothetical protein L288_01430 [Sphingobium quisquiliarum P25]|uniref:cellulase n=1 Tax=Sphingobium quisquiliarum P25 TaxID=1329909 RepID=T0HNC2_9SPHN|nr:glycosyl hydrolase family 8 [Sphingobium quisquiliarum]EQB14532.1 hypothetical protein L288_01430 [Sphingobium quisquiliarum P25]
MGVDRRTFALAAFAMLTSSCARAGERRTPVKNERWAQFKSAFLDSSGRIIDNGNGGVSHSEGQGYGLWLALRAGDRPAFDSILEWTETTLARKDLALYAWRFDPRQPVPVADRNNATDGDIFLAWALAQAGETWKDPALMARSEEIRAAILSHLVIEQFGRRLLLPGLEGFATANVVTVNPSYFVWPALDKFRQLDGEAVWGNVIADSEKLLAAARFGPRNLPADWVDVTANAGVTPAASKPPRFGFDALRIPLYALAGGRRNLVTPVIDCWRAYVRAGRTIPAWIDVRTGQEAEFALSPGGLAIASKALNLSASQPLSNDYYAASLQMLAQTL